MSAACINSVGLVLDIIGVILLFIFGLPNRFVSDGPPTNTLSFGWDPDSVKQWEKRWNWYERVSRFAVVLLVLGFALQIVSNHLGPSPSICEAETTAIPQQNHSNRGDLQPRTHDRADVDGLVGSAQVGES